MFNLDDMITSQSLVITMKMIDDNIEDLRDAEEMAKKNDIEYRSVESVTEWGNLLEQHSDNAIFLSDNYLEGLPDLEPLGFKDITTDDGTKAGVRLLTAYLDQRNIKPGLKILLTHRDIDKNTTQFLARRRGNGDNIHAFRKANKHHMRDMSNLIRDFAAERRINFIKEKFNFVVDMIDTWKLNDVERNALLGVVDDFERFREAVESGGVSRDLEARCDLVYRIKMNLFNVYGGVDPEQETLWLRTSIRPLDGLSPLEFVANGHQYRLIDLVSRMEGPY